MTIDERVHYGVRRAARYRQVRRTMLGAIMAERRQGHFACARDLWCAFVEMWTGA